MVPFKLSHALNDTPILFKMAALSTGSEEARKTFELANNIQQVSNIDAIFKYSPAEQQELLAKKPWEKE